MNSVHCLTVMINISTENFQKVIWLFVGLSLTSPSLLLCGRCSHEIRDLPEPDGPLGEQPMLVLPPWLWPMKPYQPSVAEYTSDSSEQPSEFVKGLVDGGCAVGQPSLRSELKFVHFT